MEHKNYISVFENALQKLQKKEGSLIFIEAESGYGKTHLIYEFIKLCSDKKYDVFPIYKENDSPIGKTSLANFQPFATFNSIIMQLAEGKQTLTAKQKFGKNTALTLLTAIPILGEVTYAVKEISRDWKEYKSDSAAENIKKENKTVSEYFKAIESSSIKKPLVLLIDDAQWSDNLSIELMKMISSQLNDLPVILLLAYEQSEIRKTVLPISTFINSQFEKNKNYYKIELQPFDEKQTMQFCKSNLVNYKQNAQFDKWIYEKTYGVPAVLIEFIKYFNNHLAFDEQGNLIVNLDNEFILPTNAVAALSSTLENLSEEEKNLLALCACEGREFTAFMIGKLLNCDSLSAIKKLRVLQNRSDIILSMGAANRYGVKTTVYKFTQPFYYTYFENLLEWEEHQSIHSEITAILNNVYNNSNDEEKERIAPYLAAHSIESGNEKQTQAIIQQAQALAEQSGQASIYQELLSTLDKKYLKTDIEQDSHQILPITNNQSLFEVLSQKILSQFNHGNFTTAAKLAEELYENNNERLSLLEKVQMLSMSARSYTAEGDLEKAKDLIKLATSLTQNKSIPLAECFILNTKALYESKRGNDTLALSHLKKAAQLSIKLPAELKLLTITNIALILKDKEPNKAKTYFQAAEKLSEELNFKSFNHFFAS